ncbi:hypothetical protein HAX54_023632 [Datura stramonium]|uniref:Uncharacterized protein n=1 Tax=Datura stramonium TaxID=4076 RepID=A0ABS8S4V9_DATST|nr:hypothetical protein [Datura stramonium]
MAKFDKVVALLLLSFTVITIWLPIVHCSKKAVGVARKEDIPFIKCQVCEKLAYQLYHQVQNKQAEISPRQVTFSSGVPLFLSSTYLWFGVPESSIDQNSEY